MSRRSLLLALLAVAAPSLSGCADSEPDRPYTQVRYTYLTPLPLNVGSVEVAPLPRPGTLDDTSPLPPGPALQRLVEDRIAPAGSSGRARITIDEARVTRTGRNLEGTMALRLEILAADGTRAALAEARVVRRLTPGPNLRNALYDITRQMLDDMNVELEFQLRRTLRDYLQTTGPAPAPAAVEKQDL